MYVDNSPALDAVSNIKNHVANCFRKCTEKGSTFGGNTVLANLSTAIEMIPQDGGGTSGTPITGADFSGFSVTWNEDGEDVYTVNFGSYGTDWKAISCYSNSRDGHYNIVKVSSTHCIISGAYFVDLQSQWDENFGIYPMQRGTFRARYSISGSSITFMNDEYDGAENGFSVPDGFVGIATQASNTINDYYTNPYKLDKITVLY